MSRTDRGDIECLGKQQVLISRDERSRILVGLAGKYRYAPLESTDVGQTTCNAIFKNCIRSTFSTHIL